MAHLDLGEDELAAALPTFEQMLGYFAAMRAADKDSAVFGPSVSPRSQRTGATIAQFRTDENNHNPNTNPNPNPPNNLKGLSDSLLNSAGERDGRFILVPNVL